MFRNQSLSLQVNKQRFFAAQPKQPQAHTILPHIKATIFLTGSNNSFRSNFNFRLAYEFKYNVFCQPMLSNLEKLFESNRCSVERKIKLTPQEEKFHIGYYNEIHQKIVMAEAPEEITKFLYKKYDRAYPYLFYKNENQHYFSMFLHEANHAHDYILGKFFLNTKDRPVKYNFQVKSWNQALSLHYESIKLTQMRDALAIDFKKLFKILKDNAHPLYNEACLVKDVLENIADRYPTNLLLLEFKSRFVEFSTSEALGSKKLEELFPNFSDWYLNTYMPACNEAVTTVLKLRR